MHEGTDTMGLLSMLGRLFGGGILTGHEIDRQVRKGRISIDNYSRENLNPNSYNIAIGNTYTVYEDIDVIDLKDPSTYKDTVTFVIPDEGVVLRPGNIYLVPTAESIGTDFFEPIITGRSSIGRLGICVHQEAGFGDIGYHGNMTLQIKVTRPTRIYANLRLCQVYFLTPRGKISELYHGHYSGGGNIASKWAA